MQVVARPYEPQTAEDIGSRSVDLGRYLVAAFAVVLLLCIPFLRRAWRPEPGAELYALALTLSQATLYFLPTLLLACTARWLLLRSAAPSEVARWRRGAVLAPTLVAATLTTLILAADERIFAIFGFHLNGFVVNLVTTPGGIDSMGIGHEGIVMASLIAAASVLLQGILLWSSRRPQRRHGLPRRVRQGGIALIGLAVLGERGAYMVGEANADAARIEQANAFPLYQPLTMRKLLVTLGVAQTREEERDAWDPGASQLHYPSAPLRVEPPGHPLNVVWLVGESLRWDLLTPEIMPNVQRLADEAWSFEHHYSGGNGTRMGMFSMFYGLYGPYWFSFLSERRSPVLMQVLEQQNYQFGIYSSARFSYPEFDRTIFADLPPADLHDSAETYYDDDWERGWKNDRARTTDLIEFLDQRDRTRPFFSFLFFESTHYRYYFPEESVIQRPYLTDVDLGELSGPDRIELTHARYVNAAHHLDQQIGRIVDYLERDDRLEDTLILITGDHGEEFWEKGRRGHNSDFHEEQLRVPLVLWIPGAGHRTVGAMTSHVDIAPTLLPLFGVQNPASDYSLGFDLSEPFDHDFVVASDWSRIGVFDDDFKIALPIRGTGLLLDNSVTGQNDEELGDPALAYRRIEPELHSALVNLRRFLVPQSG